MGVPVDKLEIFGRSENYSYRWVKDVADRGSRIERFRRGGWELVESSEITVGRDFVHVMEDHSSIVRYPSGVTEPGTYLYLMKIRKEFYDEDQVAKEDAIREREEDMFRERNTDRDDGQYGRPVLKQGARRT